MSPTNKNLTIPASLALTIMALTIGSALTVNAGGIKEGDSFPDLKTFNLEGELPDLAGKVIIVDFFASWCGPCKESFPAMQELHEQFAGKGVVILAVNLDKKEADMKTLLEKFPVTFPVVRDGANALVKEVKIATMPSSFVIDRTGKVRFLHRGYKGEKTKEEYVKQITELLN